MTAGTETDTGAAHRASADRASADRVPTDRAPLTWGQRWPWLDACQPPEAREFEAPRIRCPVPAGLGTAAVQRAVRQVLIRCESLRTTYHVGPDGEPYQQVRDVGTVPVRLVPVTEDSAYEDGERLLDEAQRALDVRDHSCSFAILTAGTRPVQVVGVLSHVAADAWAAVLVRELVSDALCGTAATPARPEPQPLTEVAAQSTPTGRERDLRAEGRRAEHRKRLPHTLFPASRPSGRSCPATRAQLGSTAVALAAELLSRRHRTPLPSVYLAAYAATLWAHTGFTAIGMDMASVNRATPQRRRLVSSVVLPALAVLEVRPDERFAELLPRAAQAVLEASGASEGDHTRRMMTDVVGCHERGVHFYCSPELNLLLPAGTRTDPTRLRPEAVSKALPATRARTERINWFDRFRLEVRVHRGRADLQLWTSDAVLRPEQAMAVLRDFETILVRSVADEPALEVLAGELVGRPPVRDRSWSHVDNCWVRPDELRALLCARPEIAHCAVFVVDGRITAYLVPRNGSIHPGRIHRYLVNAITRRPSVMAAHQYVVCTRPPEDVADPDGWRRMPVVSSGDGRGPIQPPTLARTDRQGLLLDVVRRLGAPDAELDDCYPVAGGRLLRVPAILDALRAAGWQGLTMYDFASTRSLGELADSLLPAPGSVDTQADAVALAGRVG